MILRWLMLSFTVIAVAGGATAKAEGVDYLVRPVVGETGLDAIEVEVRFTGDKDGETEIALPDQWAGSDRLYEALTGFSVKGELSRPSKIRRAALSAMRPSSPSCSAIVLPPWPAPNPAPDMKRPGPCSARTGSISTAKDCSRRP